MENKHKILNDSRKCLSYDMRNQPTLNQLFDRDGDTISAKIAYAIDTGLNRMSDAHNLHHELAKRKGRQNENQHIPSKFLNLKKEIENENNLSNMERIRKSFQTKINRKANLKACAACGIRNFEMGGCKFYQTKLSDLEVLAYTKEELSSYEVENSTKK